MLVLASASARRRDLLTSAGVALDVIHPADVDETPLRIESPSDYVKRIAHAKAECVAAQCEPSAIILAADTIVNRGRHIMGKPKDAEHAKWMLRTLNGSRHRVITAVVVRKGGVVRSLLATTRVQFARLSAQQQDAYICSGHWQGFAGGYAIQAAGAQLIRSINGSHSNVIGLPLAETLGLLDYMQQSCYASD